MREALKGRVEVSARDVMAKEISAQAKWRGVPQGDVVSVAVLVRDRPAAGDEQWVIGFVGMSRRAGRIV